MAHSMEARVPFFDRALVEMAFSLPAEYKIGNGDRKRILRDVARRRLPAEITERGDRMGFPTPDRALIEGPLRQAMVEPLAALGNAPSFDRTAFAAAVNRFRKGDSNFDRRMLWRALTLAVWCDVFGVSLQ